jgi:integrase
VTGSGARRGRRSPHAEALKREARGPRMPVDRIARLVGHSSTATTELVYHHQIRPVVQGGAEVMDRLFPGESPDA